MLIGPIDAAAARKQRLSGGCVVLLVVIINAMPVSAAVPATFITTPAEKSLLFHDKFLRELLDRLVLNVLIWFDTRDMRADGLTKGIVRS